MKLITKEIGNFAILTGYIHEPSGEMPNIEAFPAILILPGGGFMFCSERESEPIALAYFAEGFQAFTLKYTTVTTKPDAKMEDPILDTQAAMTWIRDNAGDLFVAEHKLALIGFSGGAHLAAAVATRYSVKPDALLLGYPGILHSDLRKLECPDIIEKVDASTPKTFIFGTRNDTITPPRHALALADALEKNGVDFELHLFRNGHHGLSLAKPLTCAGSVEMVNPRFAQWFGLSMGWLWEVFGEFASSSDKSHNAF